MAVRARLNSFSTACHAIKRVRSTILIKCSLHTNSSSKKMGLQHFLKMSQCLGSACIGTDKLNAFHSLGAVYMNLLLVFLKDRCLELSTNSKFSFAEGRLRTGTYGCTKSQALRRMVQDHAKPAKSSSESERSTVRPYGTCKEVYLLGTCKPRPTYVRTVRSEHGTTYSSAAGPHILPRATGTSSSEVLPTPACAGRSGCGAVWCAQCMHIILWIQRSHS